MIKLFVGYDHREHDAYDALCRSVLDTTSVAVEFIPLKLEAFSHLTFSQDGSKEFTYLRFLVPHLMNYEGVALYMDSDMIVRRDLAKLIALFDPQKAVQVVKHDYKTRLSVKFNGNPNPDYPRKNWSSLILWNCSHQAHRRLVPEQVSALDGSFLHRFAWLEDSSIGSLPVKWNWLVGEYPEIEDPHVLHFTLGLPEYKEAPASVYNQLYERFAS